MRIEIEIPKEFECDYDADKFRDFFSRAMIDIETMQGMCGRYEVETAEMFRKAFAESKVAYDVEAVVAELEELKERGVSCEDCAFREIVNCIDLCEKGSLIRAIEIVRNGGKE